MGNRLSVITTRTGDDGTTGLSDGSRIPKNHPITHAMGDVDELNSHLGVVIAHLSTLISEQSATHPNTEPLSVLKERLIQIQHHLFNLGGELSMPGYELIKEADVLFLDQIITELNQHLPRLREFILPGGHMLSAHTHVCRTICRRAERAVIATEPANLNLQHYLNRLSDLLFVMARYINQLTNSPEPLWQHTRNAQLAE